MGSAIFGILIALAIVIGSIIETTEKKSIFLDPVGILIVVGGTISAAIITFPFKDVLSILKISWAVFTKDVNDAPQLVQSIIELARDTRGDVRALQSSLDSIKDPFLKDAVGLIVDRHEVDKIEMILRDRIRAHQERNESNANMLRTLAKYPPALGIVGTVLGLIAMLQGLGGKLSQGNLGPAMAVGLVATFYGLILTNFVLTPMSENLALKSYKDIHKRMIVLQGVLLIKNAESPLVIQEALNSHLTVSNRVDVLGVNGGKSPEAGGRAA